MRIDEPPVAPMLTRRHARRLRRLRGPLAVASGSRRSTITRDADSPNSVAASRSTPPSEAAARDRDVGADAAGVETAFGQRTAKPPSAQSCADLIKPRDGQIDEQALQRPLARQVERAAAGRAAGRAPS